MFGLFMSKWLDKTFACRLNQNQIVSFILAVFVFYMNIFSKHFVRIVFVGFARFKNKKKISLHEGTISSLKKKTLSIQRQGER